MCGRTIGRAAAHFAVLGGVCAFAQQRPPAVPLAELLESVLPRLGEGYANMDMKLDDAAWVGHRLAEILPIPLAQKQFCLELNDPLERLEFLAPLVSAQTNAPG